MSAAPWRVEPAPTVAPALVEAAGDSLLLARLLVRRGLTTPQAVAGFLDPLSYPLAPPTALHGIDAAATLLLDTLDAGRNVLVWGDFDVDGLTGAALYVDTVRQLAGPHRVRYHIPHRTADGHGIQPGRLTELLAASDIPLHLLLTCDTGICEPQAVAVAKAAGMAVIITDHHELPDDLRGLAPEPGSLWRVDAALCGVESVRRADAVVNPMLHPPGDPQRVLPGVGVAFKLAQELFARAGRAGNEEGLLDLVALGIVADVSALLYDARALLHRGIERLRSTRRVGLQALMEQARILPAAITEETIGYQIAPRLNALGRLDDANAAVDLLITDDPAAARTLAARIERLNQERRILTDRTLAQALEMVQAEPSLLDGAAIVLADPGWHAGVLGIVAARLVQEFDKPAVLLRTPPGQPARGSARTTEDVDIGAAVAACAPLLLVWGGHRGAAGLTLEPEQIPALRAALDEQVPRHCSPAAPAGLALDAELPLAAVTPALAAQLARLAPFGPGNPAPAFLLRGLEVTSDQRIGREGIHRRLIVQDMHGDSRTALWFRSGDAELPPGPVDLAAHVAANEFRGTTSAELHILAVRPAQLERSLAVTRPRPQVVDLRGKPIEPDALPSGEDAAWYAEGTLPSSRALYAPRGALRPARALVLWSIPPARTLLDWILRAVNPAEIFVCGRLTTDDSFDGLLRNTAGMCRYALGRDGLAHLGRMAARLGTTEAVVRAALLALEAEGLVRLAEWLEGDLLRIAPGTAPGTAPADPLSRAERDAHLRTLLAEVRAYRRFFQRARLDDLGLAPPPAT